jgi:hypothetical protein
LQSQEKEARGYIRVAPGAIFVKMERLHSYFLSGSRNHCSDDTGSTCGDVLLIQVSLCSCPGIESARLTEQQEVNAMADEKDRFGETLRLVERAKEDIFFAQRDRELIEKLKAQLQKVEHQELKLHCPKCPGRLDTYTFQGFILDRCERCGGMWMDEGEIEGIVKKANQGSLGYWLNRFLDSEAGGAHK